MIPRYSRTSITHIWSEENKFQLWLNIELLVCKAQANLKLIPLKSLDNILQKARFEVTRIKEIEKTTHHEMIAFLTNLAEQVGEDARYIHHGLTSSDILDTCLAIQLQQSGEILLEELKNLLAALKKQAYRYKDLVCIGRSHGIHAEPIALGVKFARFYAEFTRNYQRLVAAKKEVSTCTISGAMGNFANVSPLVEEYVAQHLNLTPEPVATQIIPRDRHAFFMTTLGVIASSIENLATEIRHLQRTELGEIYEPFSTTQKGSSAMPHKKNPILSENLVGLARIIRAGVVPALENTTSWHERDIAHSAVERCLLPDACIALDFALYRLTQVINNLVISTQNITQNLTKTNGLIFSQRVLLALVDSGMSREKAYEIVQKHAIQSSQDNFFALLENDKEINNYLTKEKLSELFEVEFYKKHSDTIFTRVFNKES